MEWIIIGLILVGGIGFSAILIGARADYMQALMKCKGCPHYTGKNDSIRLIYCNSCAVTPEEVMECAGKFNKIIEVRNTYLDKFPNWRKGQCLFNAIYYVAPELGNMIRGSDIDPFHCDENIEKCLQFIKQY